MLEPFQLPFVQHGIVEVLILAVAGGLIGTWIVLRGLAFYAHAVGTAARSEAGKPITRVPTSISAFVWPSSPARASRSRSRAPIRSTSWFA